MNHQATTTLKCALPISAIKAALLFAGKEDIRGYLNGLCVEFAPGTVRLIAVDGHRLIVQNIPLMEDAPSCAAPVRFVVARDAVNAALKLAPKRTVAIECTYTQTTEPDTTRVGVTIVSVARIDFGGVNAVDLQATLGRFPEWERVVPNACSGELAQYNADYLADAQKAGALLGNRFISVGYNGTSPALITLTDNAFAIVMPMRGADPTEIKLPGWYANPGAKKAAA